MDTNKQECALCLVRSEKGILLVRQAYGLHLWTLPGGLVEPGESYTKAAIRELREETGLVGCVTGLVSLRTRGDQTLIVFAAEVTGGELLESVPGEIEATGWFNQGTLDNPDLEFFSAFVAKRAGDEPPLCLPFWAWKGGSGDADMFIGPLDLA